MNQEIHPISRPGLINGFCFLDFDGTLLGADKTIGNENKAALEDLGRREVVRVIATGRSYYSFLKAAEPDLPVDYVIFSTGAGILTFKQGKTPEPSDIVFKTALSEEDVTDLTTFLENEKLDYMIQETIPDNHMFTYRHFRGERKDQNPDFFRRIDLYNPFCSPLPSEGISNGKQATQFLSILPPGSHAGRFDDIKKRLSSYNVVRSTSPLDGASIWVEIFPKSVSKSQTAEKLIRMLGFNPSPDKPVVMAVGNDYNDADLLEWAQKSYVVGNAPVELKQRHIVTATYDKGGAAQAVRLWINELELH